MLHNGHPVNWWCNTIIYTYYLQIHQYIDFYLYSFCNTISSCMWPCKQWPAECHSLLVSLSPLPCWILLLSKWFVFIIVLLQSDAMFIIRLNNHFGKNTLKRLTKPNGRRIILSSHNVFEHTAGCCSPQQSVLAWRLLDSQHHSYMTRCWGLFICDAPQPSCICMCVDRGKYNPGSRMLEDCKWGWQWSSVLHTCP